MKPPPPEDIDAYREAALSQVLIGWNGERTKDNNLAHSWVSTRDIPKTVAQEGRLHSHESCFTQTLRLHQFRVVLG